MKVTKKTRLLAAVPIAQTSDGKVKVVSIKDGGQSAEFIYGHDWVARGEGFSMGASLENWWINSLDVADGETVLADMIPEVTADGKTLTVKPLPDGEHADPGTYPNAALRIHVGKEDASETLRLPIRFVVND